MLPFYEELADQQGDDPKTQFTKARAYLRVGNIYRNLQSRTDGREPQAEAAYRTAISVLEGLAQRFPKERDYRYQMAIGYYDLANLLFPTAKAGL